MDPIDSNTRDHTQAYAQPTEAAPNSTTVLVLGILSIILAGLIGLILGIIALNMAGKAQQLAEANPGRYTPNSVSNLKGGRICAIIGVVILCLAFLFIIIVVVAAS